jgi:hypothetical protein
LNRIIGKMHSDGPAVANGVGRLASVTDGWSATNYTAYDAMGRVTASNQVTLNRSTERKTLPVTGPNRRSP